eukprot:6741614-Prymnesium_polylepis.1
MSAWFKLLVVVERPRVGGAGSACCCALGLGGAGLACCCALRSSATSARSAASCSSKVLLGVKRTAATDTVMTCRI